MGIEVLAERSVIAGGRTVCTSCNEGRGKALMVFNYGPGQEDPKSLDVSDRASLMLLATTHLERHPEHSVQVVIYHRT